MRNTHASEENRQDAEVSAVSVTGIGRRHGRFQDRGESRPLADRGVGSPSLPRGDRRDAEEEAMLKWELFCGVWWCLATEIVMQRVELAMQRVEAQS